ncbi:MAG: 30S ribosomal protein S20 [Methylococcales bacterium]|nr:30S ribosomal protein S20 [Methylococcales bacterium]
MANTLSAAKRARQAVKRNSMNSSKRTQMRTSIKNVSSAIESGDKSSAEAAFKIAMPLLDKMAQQGLIKKNKAARHKSRISAHIKGMS